MNGLLGSIDDPRTAGLLGLGLRLMSTPGKFGQALGTAGLGAMGDMRQAQASQDQRKRAGLQDQLVMLQLAQAKAQQEAAQQAAARQQAIEGAYSGALESPAQQALAGGGGPTVANATAMQGMQPRLNQNKLIEGLMRADPMSAAKMLTPEKPNFMSVDGAIVQTNAPGGPKPVYERQKPTDWNQLIVTGPDGKPTLNTMLLDAKRSIAKDGATNIGLPKIEVKMGESTAGQIGPMAKDSRVQAGGAVTMWDAASRIEKALESGKVMAGPMASKVQTVKQFVQNVAGGNDESIRQTQQVIRGLAKMAVEARKQLAGQGQVTESEAKAVEKADGGNIDELTTGELADLVKLTKRAAHMTAKGHQELLSEMERNEATRGSAPFYRVRGLEPLLKHDPQLPQIGGANGAVFLGFEPAGGK